MFQFHNALATLAQSGVLPGVFITLVNDDSSESGSREKKRHKAQEQKQHLAHEAKQIIANLEGEGWTLAFTDGSAKQHPKLGWVAGYGCVVMGQWEAKGYLPPATAQTNSRAELLAGIRAFSINLCQFGGSHGLPICL